MDYLALSKRHRELVRKIKSESNHSAEDIAEARRIDKQLKDIDRSIPWRSTPHGNYKPQ